MRLHAFIKQAPFLADFNSYVFCFTSTAKVEELLTEIKESEAEVVRWREACELEVEAAKKAIEERDKLVNKITSTLPGFNRIIF